MTEIKPAVMKLARKVVLLARGTESDLAISALAGGKEKEDGFAIDSWSEAGVRAH